MLLPALNDVLARLGYAPVDTRQRAALLNALPRYCDWLADCIAHGAQGAHWDAVRSAQLGASRASEYALNAIGLDATLSKRIEVIVRGGRPVRAAIAAVIKHGAQHCPAQARELLQQVFATGPERSVDRCDTPGGTVDRRSWAIHHIYGTRFGLTLEQTTAPNNRSVLQVEAAQRIPGRREFDWPGKIAVQLVDHEIVEMLAVLRGKRASASFSHHGQHRDKFVELRTQPDRDGFVLSVRQGSTARAVPIAQSHGYRILSLAIGVLRANDSALSPTDVLALADAALAPLAAP